MREKRTYWTVVFALMGLLFLVPSSAIADSDSPLEWHTFWDGIFDDEVNPDRVQTNDKGKAIAFADGFLYTAGFSSGLWNVDPTLVRRKHYSEDVWYSDAADGYVSKMTLNGDVVWLTYLGSHFWDEVLDIAVVAGSIYVCGYGGVWGYDLPEDIKHAHYPHGGNDAFIARLTLDGDIEWLTFLGGHGEDFATEIAVDGDSGFIYVAGYSVLPWTVDGYQGTPRNLHSNDGREDAFAAKMDLNGALIWHTFMGAAQIVNQPAAIDYGSGIDFDAAGNVYVGGTSATPWGSPESGYEHRDQDDGFIVKLDEFGDPIWHLFMGANTTPSNVKGDRCHDLVVDEAGNVYATGYTSGNWGSNWGTLKGGHSGLFEDIFAAKINTDGEPQWHAILGADGGNQGNDIVLDNSDWPITFPQFLANKIPHPWFNNTDC